jgi:hypothetical protein
MRLVRPVHIGRRIGLALVPAMLAMLASGCAMHAPQSVGSAAVYSLPDTASRNVITEWQRRLGEHVATAGSGDPAVLSQLPALRSAAVLRPGRIVFAATDVEAFVPERDGYDVFGLLVGKQDSTSGTWYLFIVGAIERRDYRPVALADIRAVALSTRKAVAVWETGSADSEALAIYSRQIDTSTALRFPADRDEFRVVACAQQTCVEETRSGARWSVYLGAPVSK